MIGIALALVNLFPARQAPANEPKLVCVKMMNPYEKSAEPIDYRGVRYGTCCDGCASSFIANPEAAIKQASEKGVLIGYGLFDPVTGARIVGLPTSPYSDYKGVRYYFKEASEKSTFDAEPAKFTKAPDKEMASFCVVMPDQKLTKETDSGGYVDYKGTRFYVCCGSCFGQIKNNPAKFCDKYIDQAKAASAHLVPATAQ
jgi:YHS domain-containing protein